MVSCTVTVKEAEPELPAVSVAVQVTEDDPMGCVVG